MEADWKSMDSAVGTWEPGSAGTRILVCDRWNDIAVMEWNQGNGGTQKAGWRYFPIGNDNGDPDLKPEYFADMRWDNLPAGYVKF